MPRDFRRNYRRDFCNFAESFMITIGFTIVLMSTLVFLA